MQLEACSEDRVAFLELIQRDNSALASIKQIIQRLDGRAQVKRAEPSIFVESLLGRGISEPAHELI